LKRNITAVVFDYGNVLVKINRLKICKSFAKHSPITPEEICSKIFGTDIEIDSETGKYDSKEHFNRIKERICAREDWTYEDFYKEFKDGFDRNPDGEEALKYASKKARVFILSNTSPIHAQWLMEHRDLSSIPELFIFSFQVGFMKPDRRIWQVMCRLGNVHPEECIYVDDVSQYCEVAEEMGFNVINYDYNGMKLKNELSKLL